MSDRMNQKRRRAYEEKEKKFMENHKRNKETKHLYAAKTDCLLECSDSDPFFGSSSVDESFREWILKYGKCCLPSRRIRCQR